MRALILSDIHANMQALAAVLAAAPEHDIVWNLGDVVGYGASPNETIVCLKELNSVYVRGNHDRACCGLTSLDDFNPVARQAAEWTHGATIAQPPQMALRPTAGPGRGGRRARVRAWFGSG